MSSLNTYFHTVEIGSLVLQLHALPNFSQSYGAVGQGAATLRMMSGRAVRQVHWRKIATQISGSGTLPPGLRALDTTISHVIKCAAADTVMSASNVIAIPSDRRSGGIYEPAGFALVGDEWIRVVITDLTNNIATLTITPGATQYRVDYWPQFDGFIDEPEQTHDVNGAAVSWRLQIEEI